MDRRKFVKTAIVGTVATCGVLNGSMAICSEKKYDWKMVSAFPENIISGKIAARIAKTIETLSNGRIKITLFYPDKLVKAFESFDAVSKGTADLGFGINYYWPKKDIFYCFSAVPFGLNFVEMAAWLTHCDGQSLWDELYSSYNIKPFLAGNSGAQMGGWFNKEIKTIEDLKGIKMRIGGLGKKVLEKIGVQAATIPVTEVIEAMKSGKLDAAEWANPYEDSIFGFQNVAKFYYWPGWHEPQGLQECIVNKKVYNALPDDLKEVIKHATMSSYLAEVAEYIYLSGDSLVNLLQKHNVQLRHFPNKVLATLAMHTKEVLQEIAAQDALSKKIIDSYINFRAKATGWSQIGEEGASQARSEIFS